MKLPILLLSFILAAETCFFQNKDAGPASQPVLQLPDTIDFDKTIKPIFIKNCSPCHFPGGKMYDRLPFDKDTTIINHSGAILKRIRNEEENSLLKEFNAQKKNGPRKEGH